MDRSGIPCYLVYYHRGEIKVKHGNVSNVFHPDGEYAWMTKIPTSFMKVSGRGKVLVLHESDIPKAKQMIYDYYLNKIDEINNKAIASLSNIAKMIKENE